MLTQISLSSFTPLSLHIVTCRWAHTLSCSEVCCLARTGHADIVWSIIIIIIIVTSLFTAFTFCTVYIVLWMITYLGAIVHTNSINVTLYTSAQWSQHGGQKQYRTKYRTVSTSRRRCIHPRCRTRPTTRNEKTTDKTTKYATTTKLQENFTRQYRATIQRAIPVEKHNYPYKIKKKKIDVPQHQP